MENDKEDKIYLLTCDLCKNRHNQNKSPIECECRKLNDNENDNDTSLVVQPDFHVKKIGCCEVFFKLYKKCALTKLELKSFDQLKSIMQINYDEDNSEHESLLSTFYETVFSKTPTGNLKAEDWKKLGFQVYFLQLLYFNMFSQKIPELIFGLEVIILFYL